jgi:RHS repeat-associated protein
MTLSTTYSEQPSSSPSSSPGKERDAEDGLDYFGARYYSSAMGRFMSPDWSSRPEGVPYAQLDNPQSLNLYGYVGNDPADRVDPDGHMMTLAEEQASWGDMGDESAVSSLLQSQSDADLAEVQAAVTKQQNDEKPAAQQAQKQIGADYTPPGGTETLGVTAGRINNETNGMKDSKNENMSLSDVEKLMAHQRFNAEKHYGKNVQKRAGTMAPLMHGPGYKRALAATIAAAREAARGVDPTHGAFQYNMRTPAQAVGGDRLRDRASIPFPAPISHHRSTPTS